MKNAILSGLCLLAMLNFSAAAASAGKSEPDSDKDGLPDSYEVAHGLDPNNASDAQADPDRDGFSSLTEYLVGTDPKDSSSHPTMADDRDKIAGWWPLWTNAAPALGAGPDGLLKNGAGFEGNCLDLDGRGAYVNFGSNAVFSSTGGMACALWIMPDHRDIFAKVLGKFSSAENRKDYSVFLLGGRVFVFYSDNGTEKKGHSIVQVTRQKVVNDGKWTHLAVSWDPVNGSQIFVNGMKTATWNLMSAPIKSLHAGSADFTLGAFDIFKIFTKEKKQRVEREVVTNPFRGRMSGLLFFRESLTEIEARELYVLGRNGDVKTYLDMDFDGDGMPDWLERQVFGDTSKNPNGDEDGDGLGNADELRYGTDPFKADSDGDGYNDGLEIALGTDPGDPASYPPPSGNNGDLDGNGLPDVWELKYFGRIGADPGADPDGDAWSNMNEYLRGGHPSFHYVGDTNNVLRLRIFTPLGQGAAR